ncbi:MAG TPA: hypothetical protein VJ987_09370, partial [Anaerolineales bacterium]|nr:hypothetical protein [Anaerolineales bacterium]
MKTYLSTVILSISLILAACGGQQVIATPVEEIYEIEPTPQAAQPVFEPEVTVQEEPTFPSEPVQIPATPVEETSLLITNCGPEGGVTKFLTIDKNDPAIIYAGFDNGGLFKSENGGESWFPLHISNDVLEFNTLVIDPGNSSTLYAGSIYLFKSVDGGQSWQMIGVGLPYEFGEGNTSYSPVSALVIDPKSPAILYAGTTDGIAK